MPTFRMFRGGRDGCSSSINDRSSSSRSFTGGTPNNNHDSDPYSRRISNNSQSNVPGSPTRSPTHTYPGPRIRGSNLPRLHPQTSRAPFVPTPPGRTSLCSADRFPSVGSKTHTPPTSILRGSSVPPLDSSTTFPSHILLRESNQQPEAPGSSNNTSASSYPEEMPSPTIVGDVERGSKVPLPPPSTNACAPTKKKKLWKKKKKKPKTPDAKEKGTSTDIEKKPPPPPPESLPSDDAITGNVGDGDLPQSNPQPSTGNSFPPAPSAPFMPSPPGHITPSPSSRPASVDSTVLPPPTAPSLNNRSGLVTNTSRPSAYNATRPNGIGSMQIYRATIPQGVIPGNEFTVHAGTRRVRVRCPPTSRPGQSIHIKLPPEPISMARPTRACRIDPTGELLHSLTQYDSAIANGTDPKITRENSSCGSGAPKTYLVTIPPNVFSGMRFTAAAEGQRFKVTCPPDAGPGMKVRIIPPNTEGRQGPDKGSSLPRSAYEIFYAHMASRMRLGLDSVGTNEEVETSIKAILAKKPCREDTNVFFTRIITRSWKVLREEQKEVFVHYSREDMKHYRKEVPAYDIFYQHMSSRIEQNLSGVGSKEEVVASVHSILTGTKTIVPSEMTVAAHTYIRDCWYALDKDRRDVFNDYESQKNQHSDLEENGDQTDKDETMQKNHDTPQISSWVRLVLSPYVGEEKSKHNPRWPMSEYQLFYRHMKGRIDQGLAGVGTIEEVTISIDTILLALSRISRYKDHQNMSSLDLEKKIIGRWQALDAKHIETFVRHSREDKDRYRSEVYERYTNKIMFYHHISSRIEQGLSGVGTIEEVVNSIKAIIAGTKHVVPSEKSISVEREIESAWEELDESKRNVLDVYCEVWRQCYIAVAESKVAEDVALHMRAIVFSSPHPKKSIEFDSWIAAEKRAVEKAETAARLRSYFDRTNRRSLPQ